MPAILFRRVTHNTRTWQAEIIFNVLTYLLVKTLLLNSSRLYFYFNWMYCIEIWPIGISQTFKKHPVYDNSQSTEYIANWFRESIVCIEDYGRELTRFAVSFAACRARRTNATLQKEEVEDVVDERPAYGRWEKGGHELWHNCLRKFGMRMYGRVAKK